MKTFLSLIACFLLPSIAMHGEIKVSQGNNAQTAGVSIKTEGHRGFSLTESEMSDLKKHTRVSEALGSESRFTSVPASVLAEMTGKPSALGNSAGVNKINVKEEAERVDVTLKLDYNSDDYYPKDFFFYSEEVAFGADVIEFSEDMENVFIPGMRKGTYTFVVKFDEYLTKKGMMEWSNAFVVLQDVEIEENVALTIDPSTAINHFQGVSYLPGGELAESKLMGAVDGEKVEFREGNYYGGDVVTAIYDTKYYAFVGTMVGTIAEFSIKDFFGEGLDRDTETMFDPYINDISDRFLIFQQKTLPTKYGSVVTVAFSRGLDNLILENDYSNYKHHTEIFGHTGQGMTEEGYYPSISLHADVVLGDWSYPLSRLFWGFSAGYYNLPTEIFYSTSDNITELPVNVSTNFTSAKNDYYPATRFTLEGETFRFIGDDEVEYMPSFNYMHPSIAGASPVDEEGNPMWEGDGIYNKGLAFKENGLFNYTYGNSAPIWAGRPIIYNGLNGIYSGIGVDNYIGLAGEKRQLDAATIAVSVLHNGESVGEEMTWREYWDTAPNEDPTGTYAFILWNNLNVKVDGIDGFNTTYCEFSYEWDDYCPPTLQAVQFRDADNNFAQTFESAEEAEILVAAGNYDWRYSEEDMLLYYNYDTTPVDVKVYYAPYFVWNAENVEWKEIEMEEIPEYSNQGGYGRVMKGSLAGITESAYEGWFNLRIVVTNEQGYINRQTFGPAFRIKSLSGVEGVEISERALVADGKKAYICGNPEARFSIFSSDGKLVKSVYGSEIIYEELTGGTYIIRATSSDGSYAQKVIL